MNEVVIDSNMTFEQAINGTKAPKEVINNLVLVGCQILRHCRLHHGQIMVHKSIENLIKMVFYRFLEKVRD